MTKITFGIIALNSQPLLEYNLRALYPFAYQIIVVEGATRAAASLATPDGHSTDDTLPMLRRFQVEQDPESKLEIVFAQEEGYIDGFWPEKDQMSQAYAKKAVGDWLWQVDSDEFYKEKDMETILELLASKPNLSGISFPFYEFWGGFDYVTTGKWYLQDFTEVQRLFRWRPGYKYAKHRPPTVVDTENISLDPATWLRSSQMRKLGIYMYHYSYVFPKQAQQKVGYYSNVSWTSAFRNNWRWLDKSYYGLNKPLFLSEKGWPVLQWLERFSGEHPETIYKLLSDLEVGVVTETLRKTDDIERKLRPGWYTLFTRLLRLFMPIYWNFRKQLRLKRRSTSL